MRCADAEDLKAKVRWVPEPPAWPVVTRWLWHLPAWHQLPCLDPLHFSQIKKDVVATSGTNFQSGIDAGGLGVVGADEGSRADASAAVCLALCTTLLSHLGVQVSPDALPATPSAEPPYHLAPPHCTAVGGAQLTGCQACMEANKTEVENRIIFITGRHSVCVSGQGRLQAARDPGAVPDFLPLPE